MCGINVYITFACEHNQNLIHVMNNSVIHRGPDYTGFYNNKNASFGHTRLSIIDVSNQANQPMIDNSQRYIIVFNGEIYNYRRIKEKIANYDFKTNSDTEVILASYIKWGVDCINLFEGMFAFAIYDLVEKTTFIARDKIGIKPLYFYASNNCFVASSEIRSILKTGYSSKKISKKSLWDYFRYQTVFAEETIIEDIKMLLPGSYLLIDNSGKIDNVVYSNLFNNANISHNYENVNKNVRELLFDAVESQMVADVPIGAFLSGGIDSSIIVAIMSKLSVKPIETFSVVFNEGRFNESAYSNLIAKKYNTNHHQILIKPTEVLSRLDEVFHSMDHPTIDGINTFFLSEVTKKCNIKVALSGLGSDEIFGGYNTFYQTRKLSKLTWLKSISPVITLLSGVIKNPMFEKLSEFSEDNDKSLYDAYKYVRKIYTDKNIALFLKTSKEVNNKKCINNSFELTDNFTISKISLYEMRGYMSNILLRDTDQMSMANALEVRVPFLDFKLIDYVLGIPDKYKPLTFPKKLLVDSFIDELPAEIYKRKKMGFSFPWEYWLKNELKSFCYDRICSLSNRSYFKKEEVIHIWHNFLRGDKRFNWARIWSFVVLEEWLRKNEIE